VTALHGWTCYSAPIHSPDGRLLGVLDLSTTWDRSHPLAMTTVRSLASAIEAGLRTALPLQPRQDQPQVLLSCLGTEKAVRDGVPLLLRPRQLEILTLLALEPDGYTPERLREALYGERAVTASTFKAEISHLRRALRGGITTRRYALTTPVSCGLARFTDWFADQDPEALERHYVETRRPRRRPGAGSICPLGCRTPCAPPSPASCS
jgi:hypothetical protein